MIGFLNPASPEHFRRPSACISSWSLRKAVLSRATNVTIAYRWAEDQTRQAASTRRRSGSRRVAVIVATGSPEVALAAKAQQQNDPYRLYRFRETRLSLGLSPASPGRAAT